MNVVTKVFRVLMIDVQKYSSESHMAGFLGRIFMYRCVRMYFCVYDCMGL